jgi:uncharacterized RDD family membrane protein YckC
MVSDYYDLLGVDAAADKDTIKNAYRDQLDGASQSERAKLNKAWNVLSDPVQRERYDDARSEGWLDDAETDDESTAPAPRRGGRAAAAPRERAGRPAPVPTVVLPEGMQLAEPRARGLALLIDFSILFVVYIVALSAVLPGVLKDQYPKQSHRIDAINRNIDTLDTFKTHADDRAARKTSSSSDRKQARTDQKKFDHDVTCLASTSDLATADCKRARGLLNDRIATTSQSRASATASLTRDLKTQSLWAQDRVNDVLAKKGDEVNAAKRESKRLQNAIDDANDTLTKVAKDFQGFLLVMYAVLLVIFLLYTVPSTAITGQTLGMRLRRVRVVRVDGSKVGWAGAFARFVIPLTIALLLPQLGAIIGLGLVLWFLRDKNRQGVHDKLARTLVVDA